MSKDLLKQYNGKPKRRRRRRMDKFELDEISFVNRPAQEHATAALIKSNQEELEKNGDLVSVLTGSTDGHQHGITINVYEDEMFVSVQYAMSGEDERSHDHVIVRGADGSFVVSENDGHTHDLDQEAMRQAFFDAMTKSAPENEEAITDLLETKAGDVTAGTSGAVEVGKVENTMPNEKTADELSAKNEALQADLNKAQAISTMNDAQKAHMETLSDDAKGAFIAKSFDEREAELENLAKADPVVYKAGDGTEYHKSDDKRLVQMAKDRDNDRKELETISKQRENDRLEKFAEDELGNLPGTVEVRAAIVKSVEGIEDETIRAEALKALKAHNAKMAGAFETVGKDGVNKNGELSDKEEAIADLNKKAEELIEKGTCENKADAFIKASEMNPDLYARSRAV